MVSRISKPAPMGYRDGGKVAPGAFKPCRDCKAAATCRAAGVCLAKRGKR
jgi:hypothetical protein